MNFAIVLNLILGLLSYVFDHSLGVTAHIGMAIFGQLVLMEKKQK